MEVLLPSVAHDNEANKLSTRESDYGCDGGSYDLSIQPGLLHNLIEFLNTLDEDSTGFVEKFNCFVNENLIDTVEGHTAFVDVGVACLNVLVQANWTGPPIDDDNQCELRKLISSKELNDKAIDILELFGEEIYQLLTYPVLMLVAYMILLECWKKFHLCVTLPLWSVKCMSVYLNVTEEVNEQHLAIFQAIVNKVEQEDRDVNGLPREIAAQFYMICSHLYLKCYKYKKAKDCLDCVKELLKIEVSLTASLGKRTKFQVKDLPQLKLDVTKNTDVVTNKREVLKDLPADVLLDNDTLLAHIKYVDGNNVQNMDLSPLDQAYILCSCIYTRKTHAKDKLSKEELAPFVNTVLMSPQSWSIQLKSLYLRCTIEIDHLRKVERAISQLESLTKTFHKPTPHGKDRHLYCEEVDLKPTWVNEQVYAQACCQYGMVDTGLEIFIRLHLWDDVITCYQRLGKHGQAEEVIRGQLKVRESAVLYCLLGDCTVDKQHYEKAWEFSKHRNARSQRSLGFWHLRRKEYEKSIPYFEKSLELNCLQPETAFSLGCACMTADKIQKAAKAFQSCVSFDPENHQAWNNLASNYIRLGQIQKGYKALQESTRLSYDNWKIWENYLLVATDLGAFEDSIQACNRLVDLDRKALDIEVLHILLKATLDDVVDMHGGKAGRLKPKLFKLFAYITSKITSDPHVWEIYAKLTLSDDNDASKEKGLQLLYKSHRCYTQHTVWEKHEEEVKHVMRVTNHMMQITEDVCGSCEHKDRAITLASTTRMALSNLAIRLKKGFNDTDNEILPSVVPHITHLEESIVKMQLMIDSYV